MKYMRCNRCCVVSSEKQLIKKQLGHDDFDWLCPNCGNNTFDDYNRIALRDELQFIQTYLEVLKHDVIHKRLSEAQELLKDLE